jgi:hypothetical protein
MATIHLSLLPLVALGLLTMAALCTARVGETITAKIHKSSHRHQPDECRAHELLYGQISQDLMPWALKGIRLQNMIDSHKICSESPGLYICVLIENGQVIVLLLCMSSHLQPIRAWLPAMADSTCDARAAPASTALKQWHLIKTHKASCIPRRHDMTYSCRMHQLAMQPCTHTGQLMTRATAVLP